jgi:hypothetical protein
VPLGELEKLDKKSYDELMGVMKTLEAAAARITAGRPRPKRALPGMHRPPHEKRETS